MARISSVNKGKNGEREFAEWLRGNLDPYARRGFGQSAGGAARPDVESSMPIHVEVKRVENLNLEKAMNQAIRDARFDNIPLVAHKKNRGVWHITILASDLIRLSEVIVKAKEKLTVSASATHDQP